MTYQDACEVALTESRLPYMLDKTIKVCAIIGFVRGTPEIIRYDLTDEPSRAYVAKVRNGAIIIEQ